LSYGTLMAHLLGLGTKYRATPVHRTRRGSACPLSTPRSAPLSDSRGDMG